MTDVASFLMLSYAFFFISESLPLRLRKKALRNPGEPLLALEKKEESSWINNRSEENGAP